MQIENNFGNCRLAHCYARAQGALMRTPTAPLALLTHAPAGA